MEDIVTKICSKCQQEKWISDFPKKRNQCKKCRQEYNSAYWTRNKEELQKYQRTYYEANYDQKIRQAKEWYENNKEKHRESCKKNRYKNIEKTRELARKATKKWLTAHPKYELSWRNKNREKWNEYNRTRRAKRDGSGGKITADEKNALFNKYENKCLCCGRSGVKLTIDHIVPIKLGGLNTIDNAQPLCQSCNSSKHLKTIDYRKLYV